MPRYDYRCSDCGHEFEVKQRFSDEPSASCGECGGEARRVIHSVPVVFKGSGFYVNDYGKGSGSNGSAGSDAPSSSDAKADSDSKDSKRSKAAKDKAPASTA